MTTYGPYGNNFPFLMTMVANIINQLTFSSSIIFFAGGQLGRGGGETFIGVNFLGVNFLGVNFLGQFSRGGFQRGKVS